MKTIQEVISTFEAEERSANLMGDDFYTGIAYAYSEAADTLRHYLEDNKPTQPPDDEYEMKVV